MKKKGISPLVAVIMLIAFTLIVGGILFGWVSQFARTQRSTVQRCANARVILQSGVYDSASKNLTLVIYNYGDVDLSFVPILQYTGTENVAVKTNDVIYSESGSVVTYTIQNVDPNLEEVTIQSVDCQPPCYKCPGAQDVLLSNDIRGL
jgi:flagellin-like protein